MITTAAFWKASGERAVKTFAQTLVAAFALGTPIWDLDWQSGVGIAATAGVLSILTSVGSDAVTSQAGPSLTKAEVVPAVEKDAPHTPEHAA